MERESAHDFEVTLQEQLCRLARFGANISDAHSCFIFLPTAILGAQEDDKDARALQLLGHHSLTNDIVKSYTLSYESGLIGWVAKHRRSIHVSPFEHDSRTLGTYATDQQLKSFIGIPIPLPTDTFAATTPAGVVACDSKKSFAFSKIQGKLLEDLSLEVANTTTLLVNSRQRQAPEVSWQNFVKRAVRLSEQLGVHSVEVLRLKLMNYQELEGSLGTSAVIAALEQMHRLIQQSLPSHFPFYKLPNGDVILFLDNMMTAFYESRIHALCAHLHSFERATSLKPEFQFVKRSYRNKKYRNYSLEQLIADSGKIEAPSQGQIGQTPRGQLEYEYRRA